MLCSHPAVIQFIQDEFEFDKERKKWKKEDDDKKKKLDAVKREGKQQRRSKKLGDRKQSSKKKTIAKERKNYIQFQSVISYHVFYYLRIRVDANKIKLN